VSAGLAERMGRATGRAINRYVSSLFATGGPAFRDLGVAHAASTAGDTLVALALAGTLFFSVPTSEARGNVALYLVLTVAPFAVIGPFLGMLLTRRPTAYRLSLVWSAAIRSALAVLMIPRTEGLWLFPLAFGLLVLSRAHGISRNALLPVALDEPTALVAANARMAQIGVLAGAVVVPIGALALVLVGPGAALALAAVAFSVAALAGRRLPSPELGAIALDDPALTGGIFRDLDLPRSVRLAQLATAGVRLLNGFLLLLLAFAFRDADAAAAEFGALLAAGGLGFGLASLISPFLERTLREEPMVLAGLALEAAAAFIAAQWFGLGAAAGLAAMAGLSWGTAKFAFDGLLQSAVRPADRGLAFTRTETWFQLAWVVGAVIPTSLPLPADVGLVTAGLAALGAQVVYVAALVSPSEPRLEHDEDGAEGSVPFSSIELPWPTGRD